MQHLNDEYTTYDVQHKIRSQKSGECEDSRAGVAPQSQCGWWVWCNYSRIIRLRGVVDVLWSSTSIDPRPGLKWQLCSAHLQDWLARLEICTLVEHRLRGPVLQQMYCTGTVCILDRIVCKYLTRPSSRPVAPAGDHGMLSHGRVRCCIQGGRQSIAFIHPAQ